MTTYQVGDTVTRTRNFGRVWNDTKRKFIGGGTYTDRGEVIEVSKHGRCRVRWETMYGRPIRPGKAVRTWADPKTLKIAPIATNAGGSEPDAAAWMTRPASPAPRLF